MYLLCCEGCVSARIGLVHFRTNSGSKLMQNEISRIFNRSTPYSMLLPVQALFSVYVYPNYLVPESANVGKKFKFSEASAAELAYKAAGLDTHDMFDFGFEMESPRPCVKLMSIDDYNFTASGLNLNEFAEFDAEDLPGLRKGY